MDELKIYTDRLKEGERETLDLTLPPSLLSIQEEDTLFKDPIEFKAEVYIANEHLIIHLNLNTKARLFCCVCNEQVPYPIDIKNIYLTHPLQEIKGAIYDLTNEIRESILLQTPPFTECNQGNCLERAHIKKYLKSTPNLSLKQKDDIVHFPFADL